MAASPVCFLEQEPPSPPISLFFTLSLLSLFILISYLFYYTNHKTTTTKPKKENLFINNTNTNTNLDDDKLSPKWATLINGVGDYDPGKNGSGLDTEVAESESECGKKKKKRVKVEDDQVKEDKKEVVDLVAFGEGTVKEFKKSQKTSISEIVCSSSHMDNTIIPSPRHASSVSSNHSESANHGLLLKNQTRRNWIEGKMSQDPSKKQETFCSTSHMDNTALPSQGLASPVTISNSQDSQQRGSSSNHSEVVNHDIQGNHPGSSSNHSDSDHGFLFWLETRRNWIEGKKSQDPSKKQETFCSTSHMDNTALPSQGLASPVTISNSQDSQRGSSSNHSEVVNHDIQGNHPGISSNHSDSDHGFLFWLETRRNWIEGKKSQDPSKALKRL